MMEPLAGKRIFITGGTGLFGRWLLERLCGTDARIVLLTRDPDAAMRRFADAPRPADCAFIRGDIRSFDFPQDSFDYIIHAATPVVNDLQVNDPAIYPVIVEGTERVLAFAEAAGAARLLYVSSGAVYGIQPPEVEYMPESSPCRPVTEYGRGKRVAERRCAESSVETVIARCFAFVGPSLSLDAHFAIGNFIGSCLRGEPIVIKGDGTPLRSYMYGSDLAEWLIALLLRGQGGEVYNVGSDQPVSILELARLVRDVAGTDNEIVVHRQPVPGAPTARYVPSIDKARTQLGLEVRIDLREAIRRTLEWYRETDRVM